MTGALLVCSALWLFTAAISFGAVVISPGSERNRALWVVFYGLLSFPVSVFLSLMMAWGVHFSLDDRRAIYAMALPCLSITAVIGGFTYISVFQQGRFGD